jgi:opacity protein-like surface antigen
VKRLPAILAVLLALATPAAAAERQGTDLFAGYSFAKVEDVNRHGGNLAVGFDLFGPIDGFVDASAHWGSAESTSIDDLTLMAGPGVRFGKRGGTLIFARVLAGLVKDRASITVLDVDISESRSGFGLLAGRGVDVPITRALAVRGQADYLLWSPGGGEANCLAIGCPTGDGDWASGVRASAGIVYRFGIAP